MSTGSFSTTPQERYLEDYIKGAVHTFGPVTITEEEIVAFGKKFDPQLFHILRDAKPENRSGVDHDGPQPDQLSRSRMRTNICYSKVVNNDTPGEIPTPGPQGKGLNIDLSLFLPAKI